MQGRFELKFVIDGDTKERFLESVRDGLSEDPHGTDAVYRVSSVYFDTPAYRAVQEKFDGESVRKKYRLRYYGLGSAGQNSATVHTHNAFMEIKHRVENTVYKQRTRLSSDGFATILDDARQLANLGAHVQDEAPDVSLINDVQRNSVLQDLQAAAVVTYLREAWMGDIDQRLRITFDSRCQSYAPVAYDQVESNCGTAILDPNLIVMEVKFDRAIPCWIRDALIAQGLRLRRFSKYASGVLTSTNRQFYPEWLRLAADQRLSQPTSESDSQCSLSLDLSGEPQTADSFATGNLPVALPSQLVPSGSAPSLVD